MLSVAGMGCGYSACWWVAGLPWTAFNAAVLLTYSDVSSFDSLAETSWFRERTVSSRVQLRSLLTTDSTTSRLTFAIVVNVVSGTFHHDGTSRRLLAQSAPLSPVVGESKLDSCHFCTHLWWLPLSFTAFTFGIAFNLCAGQQLIGALCRLLLFISWRSFLG